MPLMLVRLLLHFLQEQQEPPIVSNAQRNWIQASKSGVLQIAVQTDLFFGAVILYHFNDFVSSDIWG